MDELNNLSNIEENNIPLMTIPVNQIITASGPKKVEAQNPENPYYRKTKALQYAVDNFDSSDINLQNKALVSAQKLLNINPSDKYSPIVALKQLRWAIQNPNDDESIAVKQRLFDELEKSNPVKNKINYVHNMPDSSVSQEVDVFGPLKFGERFKIKNFIDENPELQKAYLERQGYQTRINGRKIEVKTPDVNVWQPIDPSFLDPFDVTDVAWDVIQGIAEGAATGIKGLGALGAPVTGGASILPTAAIAGLIGGQTELARQGIGKALGLRPEIDYTEVGKNAALSATFGGAAKGLGVGFEKYGKNLTEAAGARLKQIPEADKVIAAWDYLGGKATKGMLAAEKTIGNLEDWLRKSYSMSIPSVRNLKSTVQNNVDAFVASAKSLLNERSKELFDTGVEGVGTVLSAEKQAVDDIALGILRAVSPNVEKDVVKPIVGQQLRSELGQAIEKKVVRASELYADIDSTLTRIGTKPDITPILDKIDQIQPKITTARVAWLDEIKDYVTNIKYMNDLNEVRSELIRVAKFSNDPQTARLANEVRISMDEARDATFQRLYSAAKDRFDVAAKSNKKTVMEIEKRNMDMWETTQSKLMEANSLWREASEHLDAIMSRPGEKVFGSPRQKLNEFMRSKPEDVFNKVLSKKDYEKTLWLINNYPEAYSKAVSSNISDIIYKAIETDKPTRIYVLNQLKQMTDTERKILFGDNFNASYAQLKDVIEQVNQRDQIGMFLSKVFARADNAKTNFGQSVVTQIKNMTPEQSLLIFGPNQQQKIAALKTVQKFAVEPANPSGTALSLATWFTDVKKAAQYAWEGPKVGPLMTSLGNRLQSNAGMSQVQAIGSMLRPDSISSDQMAMSRALPRMPSFANQIGDVLDQTLWADKVGLDPQEMNDRLGEYDPAGTILPFKAPSKFGGSSNLLPTAESNTKQLATLKGRVTNFLKDFDSRSREKNVLKFLNLLEPGMNQGSHVDDHFRKVDSILNKFRGDPEINNIVGAMDEIRQLGRTPETINLIEQKREQAMKVLAEKYRDSFKTGAKLTTIQGGEAGSAVKYTEPELQKIVDAMNNADKPLVDYAKKALDSMGHNTSDLNDKELIDAARSIYTDKTKLNRDPFYLKTWQQKKALYEQLFRLNNKTDQYKAIRERIDALDKAAFQHMYDSEIKNPNPNYFTRDEDKAIKDKKRHERIKNSLKKINELMKEIGPKKPE